MIDQRILTVGIGPEVEVRHKEVEAESDIAFCRKKPESSQVPRPWANSCIGGSSTWRLKPERNDVNLIGS